MPKYNECSIYEQKCRDEVCSHNAEMHYYLVTLYDLTHFEVKAFIIQEAITKALREAKGKEIIRLERVLGV